MAITDIVILVFIGAVLVWSVGPQSIIMSIKMITNNIIGKFKN